MRCPCPKVYTKVVRQYILVIDRYGNFHLTDTDMLIITYTDTDTDQKETNSPIPIPIRSKGIHRYQCRYRYEKLLDTNTDQKQPNLSENIVVYP